MKLIKTSHFGCCISRKIVLNGVCLKPNGSMNASVGANTFFSRVIPSSVCDIWSLKVLLTASNLMSLGTGGVSADKTDFKWSYLSFLSSTDKQQSSDAVLYLWSRAAFKTMTGEPSSPRLYSPGPAKPSM